MPQKNSFSPQIYPTIIYFYFHAFPSNMYKGMDLLYTLSMIRVDSRNKSQISVDQRNAKTSFDGHIFIL